MLLTRSLAGFRKQSGQIERWHFLPEVDLASYFINFFLSNDCHYSLIPSNLLESKIGTILGFSIKKWDIFFKIRCWFLSLFSSYTSADPSSCICRVLLPLWCVRMPLLSLQNERLALLYAFHCVFISVSALLSDLASAWPLWVWFFTKWCGKPLWEFWNYISCDMPFCHVDIDRRRPRSSGI